MKLWTKICVMLSKGRREREMADEMQAHIDGLTERNVAKGMSPEQARYAAMQAFGHVEGIKEECRDQSGWRWLFDLGQDFRYGARQLRQAPGFAAVAILTLAIGIGATTAIFSIVNNIVLRPLPYEDADRLVVLRETTSQSTDIWGVSRMAYEEWKSQVTTYESIGTTAFWPGILTGADEPIRFYGWKVSPNLFHTVGVQPFLGRAFRPEEATEGKDRVVILSYRLWQNQFNGRRDVIGQVVQINDQPTTIIGVMPHDFLPQHIIHPVIFAPDSTLLGPATRSQRFISVIGRLKTGVTVEQASQELEVIATRVAQKFPDANEERSGRVETLMDAEIGEVRPLLLMLLGAVGFLLLIACVNVANLLLARSSSRGKEIAVRAALGAGRVRIIRQMLCESLLLSLVSSVLGVIIAFLGLDLLMAYAPLSLPRAQSVAVDGNALLFSSGLALLTGIGFGIIPALQASKVNLTAVMNATARGSSEGGRRMRLRGVLVVLEFSLALVLLMAAGLLMHSFIQVQKVPLGYETATSYISRMHLQDSHYPTPESRLTFVNEAVEQLSVVPGVHSAVFSNLFPSYYISERQVAIVGQPDIDPQTLPSSGYFVMTLDYFRALEIPLVQGRFFDAHDDSDSPQVTIVSRGFAQQYFPGENPIGKQITILGDSDTTRVIIGVVGNVRDRGPMVERPFQVYVPYAQEPVRNPHLLVRFDTGFAGMESSLRRAMDLVDPDMPLSFNGINLKDFMNETISQQRYALFLFGVFSGVALLLSAMGIYGVVAFSVSQRTKEIGIRMALGAQVADIQRLIVSQTGRMLGWGLLIGLTVSLLTTQYLKALLYEVSTHDLLTYVVVSVNLILVGLIACWVPARRAAKVDPNVALRTD